MTLRVLVFYACNNKLAKTAWFKTMETYSPSLGVKGLQSRCQQCQLLLEAQGHGASLLAVSMTGFVALGLPPCGLPLWSHCILLCVFSFCLSQISLCLSLIKILVIGLSHPDNPGKIYLKILNYIGKDAFCK